MSATTALTAVPSRSPRGENFPVASYLVARRHRPAILAFYHFARTADDVADDPSATPGHKLARLHQLKQGLLGASEGEPVATALCSAARERGLGVSHALDLLAAFRQDVGQHRYDTWEELLAYCRLSAMPVGRFVLDLHGEDRATWAYADPLCAALQIINHLQDCGSDYRALDRVYLPLELLAGGGASVGDLSAERSSSELRTVIVAVAERTQALLAAAEPLAASVRDRRLASEIALIHRLAVDLAAKLRQRDPLAARVAHGKARTAWIAARVLLGRLLRT